MNDDLRFVAEHAQAQLWREQTRRMRAEQECARWRDIARKLARQLLAERQQAAQNSCEKCRK